MDMLDFDNFWTLTDEYPILEWQVQDVSVSLDDSTVGEGQQTDVTVTLTLDDDSTVTASEVADYDAGGIVDVDSGVVDTNQQGTTEITATVAGQSDSAELEVVEPPNIELESTNLDGDAVVEDSPLTATATYENDGGPGSHTAELIVDGEVVDTQSVSLEADEETDIGFEWTPDGHVGTEYDVSVDDIDLGSIDVVESGTISLADLSVPEQVGSGAPYEFTVDLENAADETVIGTVEYELEGQTAIMEPIAVDPDGSTAILGHETDVDTGLTIMHAVTVDDETLEGTSQVTEPPSFDVADVETPEDIEPGEEFDLSVTVENTGGVEGTQSVAVSSNDSEIATEELTLETDSSETISLPVTADAAGEYEYTVATADDETTATVTVSEAADDDGAADSDGSDGLPGFGAAVATAALAIAVALTTLRRRG
ncbi:CARDB domain-containing protein [Natronorubrum sp. FCH18a]|uniref:CARDB domain-containing protein n=1 Tax=Natronorubrum sp. FCH18a TaxID=3447018 RepID=UPI003F50DAAD